MKLAASNLCWAAADDEAAWGKMKELGFDEAYIDRTGNAVAPIARGIPTIGFGPGKYKLDHMVDERCSLDKIHSACAFYTNLIELSAK